MAQVDFPTRRISCDTLALVNGQSYFSVNVKEREAIDHGDRVVFVNGSNRTTRYIQWNDRTPPHEYQLSTDQAGNDIVNVPGSFILEVPAALVVNYTTRPMLVDPAAVVNTTASNPLDVRAWTPGHPRYEGSILLDVLHNIDVPIVESFIDQLSDKNAWFELPLPTDLQGNQIHLGSQIVTAYNADTKEITIINSALNPENLQGWFGRIGARTVKVISHVNTPGTNNHVIKTIPNLITGTTSQAQSNSFSSMKTCRVRAFNISPTGDPQFGATWAMDWEETNRRD